MISNTRTGGRIRRWQRTGERIRGLRDFFADSFRHRKSRCSSLHGYRKVATAVNPKVGGAEYFFNVAQASDRRGLMKDAFFDSLIQELPGKKAQIQGLQASWLAKEKTSPEPSVTTISSGTRNRIHAHPSATQHQTSVTPCSIYHSTVPDLAAKPAASETPVSPTDSATGDEAPG